MKIIICLDDNNGMLFNGRRQSMDRKLRERICQISRGNTLWMNAFTAQQFDMLEDHVVVNEKFLELAQENDFCFIENLDISSCVARINTLIIYRWNRIYPNDVSFPVALFAHWKKVEASEFAGSSHDCITEEVYFCENEKS